MGLRPLLESVGHVVVKRLALDNEVLELPADALLVRTRTKIPFCSLAATLMNGEMPSLPR